VAVPCNGSPKADPTVSERRPNRETVRGICPLTREGKRFTIMVLGLCSSVFVCPWRREMPVGTRTGSARHSGVGSAPSRPLNSISANPGRIAAREQACVWFSHLLETIFAVLFPLGPSSFRRLSQSILCHEIRLLWRHSRRTCNLGVTVLSPWKEIRPALLLTGPLNCMALRDSLTFLEAKGERG